MAGREVDAALAECGGDRNENERGEGKTSKRKKERKGKKEMGEERRERKEGVRGWRRAIRNYCGTIDKRRLRGRTTEDSLRPSDPFLSFTSSLFSASLLFSLPAHFLDFRVMPVPCPRNLPDSSICNVRRPARYATLRALPPLVLRGIEDSFRSCIFQ